MENRLKEFLDEDGPAFLWIDSAGRIVISTYHEKQFRRLGGDTERLIACFEDADGDRAATKRDYFSEVSQ